LVVKTENHGVGGARTPLGTTQGSPAKILRDFRWLALGTASRSGAAQGPHGEGGGREQRDGPGMTGTESRPADTRDGDVHLAGCLFGGSGGGKRCLGPLDLARF